MSTILKAVTDLEPDKPAGARPPVGNAGWRVGAPVLLVLTGLLSLTGMAILGWMVGARRSGNAGPAVVANSTAPEAPPLLRSQTNVAGEAASAVPNPGQPAVAAASSSQEPPWARIQINRTAPAPGQQAPSAQAPPHSAPAARPQAQASQDAGSTSNAGSADLSVRVKSIAYSADPATRRVTLQTAAGSAVLHEGQSIGGIEVQLILPGTVYLRNGGTVLALGAEP